MKTLFLIRHGTVLNPGGVVYRRLPGFVLSERGLVEAAETRDFLADQPIELIWHSPLERALQTAEIINGRHGAPLVEEPRIHEWDEGEDGDEVLERMVSFLEVWRDTKYAVCAAVSHRDPIRRLLFGIRDREAPAAMEDVSEFPLLQAGVYEVVEDEGGLRYRHLFEPIQHRLGD
jgi:broad specificity phosphatase PhoE